MAPSAAPVLPILSRPLNAAAKDFSPPVERRGDAGAVLADAPPGFVVGGLHTYPGSEAYYQVC